MTVNARDEANPNGKARWKQRRAALAWEKPAKAAMTLAVLGSLAAAFAGTLLLVDGLDPRARPAFWIMVLLVGLWGAPARVYARWTMLTLWLALLLWPALVGLAWLALWISPPVTFAEHASLRWLAGTLAVTTALSAAGLICLRRSSLPGGTGTALLALGAVGLSAATLAESYAYGSDGAMQAACVMGAVALGVAALEAVVARRLIARARTYGTRATGGRRATW